MMLRMVGTVCRGVRRFFRGEQGGGAIELVLVLPIAMTVFVAAMESALYITRSIMLDRAVDMTVRDLRLGGYANPDADLLKTEICNRVSILPRCRRDIRIEMQAVSTATWNFPNFAVNCVDREENIVPADVAAPGAENELMMLRVCVSERAMFAGTGIAEGLVNNHGRYRIVSVAAFVNEPS
jgi:Flp pilus assembly protein TadG